MTLSYVNGVDDLSCSGRCHLLTPGAACQCTVWCEEFGGCCKDYHSLCDENSQTVQDAFTLPPTPTTELTTTRTSVTVTTVTMTVTTVTQTVSTTVVTTATSTSRPHWRSVRIGNAAVKGSPQCEAFGPQKVGLQVGQQFRSMTLFLPKGVTKAPLWLVMHGTTQTVDYFLHYSGLREFAKANDFGLLALQGLRNEDYEFQFDVGPHSQPMQWMEAAQIHDVQFVKEALKQVLKLPCIDKRRVHCTGYSNGARFCMRLASEMSNIFASVAPVSGLRFPKPNQATRPIPILAFHGQSDPVNPFQGHGDPYWSDSVPDAMQRWAEFNRCEFSRSKPRFLQEGVFSVASYSGCKDNAKVEVIQLLGGGHQWPGGTFAIAGKMSGVQVASNCCDLHSKISGTYWCADFLPKPLLDTPHIFGLGFGLGIGSVKSPGLGTKSNVDANRMILNFFAQHPLPNYIDIANLQLDAVHKLDTESDNPNIFQELSLVVMVVFAIVASVAVAVFVKIVSARSYVHIENSSETSEEAFLD